MQIAARPFSRPLPLAASLALFALMLLHPDLAMAQFQKATTAAETVREWLWLIIPVIALIIAGIFGLLYSAEVIRKETLIQWGGGVVFSGALAGGIIKLFF